MKGVTIKRIELEVDGETLVLSAPTARLLYVTLRRIFSEKEATVQSKPVDLSKLVSGVGWTDSVEVK